MERPLAEAGDPGIVGGVGKVGQRKIQRPARRPDPGVGIGPQPLEQVSALCGVEQLPGEG